MVKTKTSRIDKKAKETPGTLICTGYFYMFHSVLSCVILTALSNRDPATGGRWTHGNSHIFFCDCCGRCDLPSHLQMVRQTQQGQQIAWWMLNHWNKKRRALECISGTSGGSFFVHMEHSHIFFAYWHDRICRSWNQYATAPTLCSVNIHQCRTARQRLSSDSET